MGPRRLAVWMYRGCARTTPIHRGARGARPVVSGIDVPPGRLDAPTQRRCEMTREDLDVFFTAGWNGHDVDRLMTFMAEDCVFESASGPQVCGTRHVGRVRVREAFARIFTTFPDVRFVDTRHV